MSSGVDPADTGEDRVLVLEKGKYRPFEKKDWEKIESVRQCARDAG